MSDSSTLRSAAPGGGVGWTADDVRRDRLDDEPVVLLDDDGVIRRAWGAVLEWFDGDPTGKALTSYFGRSCVGQIQYTLAHGGAGIDELRPRLLDGRQVALLSWPCGDGWLLCFRDVTTQGLVQDARTQRERLDALADLAGAVARELNDPMAIVQGRLELLIALSEDRTDDDPAKRHLVVALDHARRISATLRNLRVVGQKREQRLERVPLLPALHEAMALVGPRRDRIRLTVEPDDLAVGGDLALYVRVFSHALRQVVEGASRGEVRCVARREGKRVVVRIHLDTVRAGAPAARADGLDAQDLTIDHTLLRAVGASMEATRRSGAPAFELDLPLAPATRGRPRVGDDPVLLVGSSGFTDTVQELLDKDGFRFDLAPDAPGALEMVAHKAPSAVITELLLPGALSGLSLGKALAHGHPTLQGRLIVVGDSRIDPIPEALVALARPLSRAGLLDALGRRVRHR